MNKKVVTFVVAMVLLLGVTIGVTFALMTDKTDSITNTFVAGGFGDLELWEKPATLGSDGTYNDDEAEYQNPGQNNGNNYGSIYPGASYPKDAAVTFVPTSNEGPAYIYVKVDGDWEYENGEFVKKHNDNKVMSFSVADPEAQVSDINGSWLIWWFVDNYDVVADSPADKESNSFMKKFIDTVTVDSAVTSDILADMDDIDLIFTAYAVQAIVTGTDANGDPTYITAEQAYTDENNEWIKNS